MPREVALGLGGNLGDPTRAFAAALRRLAAEPGLRLLRTSSVYRTAPWGRTDQPDFLNMAALASTERPAADLLALCLRIEAEQGRERRERWGPRPLDIDLLTYGDDRIDQPGLHVPHPRIGERAFVLIPLAEIAPQLSIDGVTAAALASRIDAGGVSLDAAETTRLRTLLRMAGQGPDLDPVGLPG